MEKESSQYVSPATERRQHRRAKLIAEVRCQALGRSELLVTRDISAGGAFITTNNPLPAQSEVTLTFRLDPKEPSVTCRGLVVNSLAGVGMGVQFADLSEETRAKLHKFVEEAS